MCGRLSQYSGLHEFVSVLSLPNMLTNLIGGTAAALPRHTVDGGDHAKARRDRTGRPSGSSAARAGPRVAGPNAPERAEQIVLNQGEPTEAFTWYAINQDVDNVRNQGAHLFEPQRSAS